MMKIKLLLFALMSLSLIACMNTTSNTDSLAGLKNLTAPAQKAPDENATGSIRMQALQDIALSTSAQSALAYRSKQINAVLDQNANTLNRIFNFHALLLDHNVMPPVLSRGDGLLNISDCSTIRLADRMYKIEKQACFVTAPPNWRDYLYMNFSKPEKPNHSLLPKNRQEQEIWQEYVEKGWNNGIKQANSIFADNLARLKRDYNGMVLYRTLLAQNIVSRPYVAKTNLGITGDDSEMRINDQVLRITALPEFKRSPKQWQAAVDPTPCPTECMTR